MRGLASGPVPQICSPWGRPEAASWLGPAWRWALASGGPALKLAVSGTPPISPQYPSPSLAPSLPSTQVLGAHACLHSSPWGACGLRVCQGEVGTAPSALQQTGGLGECLRAFWGGWYLYWFPRAVVTKYHKLGGLKQ